MSIGAANPEKAPEIKVIHQAKYAAKKALAAFFLEPVHYLFYGTLAGVIICLFFSVRLPWQLYTILVFLGIFKLVKKYQPMVMAELPPQTPSKKEDVTTTSK